MLLKSPSNLHYPITITSLLLRQDDDVKRSTPLFAYYYKSKVSEGDEWGHWRDVEKTFPTKFESETDGRIIRWKIKAGDTIEGPNVELVEIEEPCRHDVQFGGMCANCGKDLTKVDYNTTVPDTARADTSISPAHAALRISSDEAAKLDREAKQRLLSQQKLSLVVDLDLTVIQATVDTTIGEWQDDPNNPNYDAVKDVRSFTLRDEGQGFRSPEVAYYVKMRPGLRGFLTRIAKLYELHIYTMGTRAYAENVAKIIDPQAEFFGDRILSRTETPGEVSKNLRKLFPIDSKMVVIIDDRADVWKYSDYLVPVVPYNFFVGIGDINASFLPKREDMMAKMNKAAASAAPEEKPIKEADNPKEADSKAEEATNSGDSSTLETLVEIRGSQDVGSLQQQAAEQDEELAAQLHDKPLLQRQKELDDLDAEHDGDEDNGDDAAGSQHTRQSLLQDNDSELERIERELSEIHNEFYDQYDRNVQHAAANVNGASGRVALLKGKQISKVHSKADLSHVPDVRTVIEPHRMNTLRGAVICFSGVIFTHIPVRQSLIGKTAMRLGARVEADITPDTTHLVTRPGEPTSKIRKALRRRDIKIVGIEWVFESSVRWTHLDEEPYKIEFDEEIGVDTSDNHRTGSIGESEDEEAERDAEDESLSPVKDFTPDDWDEAFAEINDLDDDSQADDSQADDSDSDNQEGTSNVAVDQEAGDRKRKLSSGPRLNEATYGVGSALQKRRKRAMERTSSLSNVVSNTQTQGDDERPDAAGTTAAAGSRGAVEDEAEEDVDDDFAELEAQLASDSDDG